MASPSPPSYPTPINTNNKHYKRAECALLELVAALGRYAKVELVTFHSRVLNTSITRADAAGSGMTTLAQQPRCTSDSHHTTLSAMVQCAACKPWVQVLGDAHVSKDATNLNVQ